MVRTPSAVARYHQSSQLRIKYQTIQSIIVVDLDEEEKIIRLMDQWDGKDLPTRFGAHFLRVLNAKLVPWFITVPKIRR